MQLHDLLETTMWNAGHLAPGDVRVLTGEDLLSDYGKSDDWGEGHHRFCSRCGIATHGRGRIDAMGATSLRCISLRWTTYQSRI